MNKYYIKNEDFTRTVIVCRTKLNLMPISNHGRRASNEKQCPVFQRERIRCIRLLCKPGVLYFPVCIDCKPVYICMY
ncbi:unnamed protein product [Nezara viridula]|uniref:Uncharacterized protein n=1 Tax=Nezara viridula TaxID=85310 RepID=A0A9P0HKU2_NEZVI|nr:unnamed protein product [Nezara viridula]